MGPTSMEYFYLSEKKKLRIFAPVLLGKDKNSRGRSAYEQSSKGIYGSDTGKYTIEHSNKFEHGTAGGGGNRATNPGKTNGGTRTPSTQGGTTFIPVYAAGAANNRHPYHRGAANSKQRGVYTLIAATMASILHLYGVFRCG
ncbi:hypothetical protein PanWU01x14_082290 [Parasponia andersonii]|uniref:Uncharacterized protein n=1 Tax=Parasponia andersonii TaxID=3476 RepID=A0A2P5DAI7_PARAD|nr:hypothetical protein PanWU01x14_082290 [Parasponia andersonii]